MHLPDKIIIAVGTALTLLSLAACSPSSTSTPGTPPPPPLPSSAPPAASPPDITVSCKPILYPGSPAGQGARLTPEVTLTTSDLVTATEIDVTVITFNAVGAQNATAVITFNGPFAPGQTFAAYSNIDVYDNNASCAVADVASDPVITYRNESPAT